MDKLLNMGIDKSPSIYYVRFVFRGNRILSADDSDTRAERPVSAARKNLKDQLALFYLNSEQYDSIKQEVENCLSSRCI